MVTRYVMVLAALAGIGWVAVQSYPARAAQNVETSGPRRPILLELFTSEGCSSCPPADRLLETLDRTQPVSGAVLIVLSEHVDYWNRLGWTDPYSSRSFTERQQEFARHLHLDGAYTPQLVIDGQADFIGSDERAIRAGILRAEAHPKATISVRAQRTGSEVKVSLELGDPMRPADLYLALANDRAQSQVTRGENSGRTLRHVAVVRSLVRVGTLPAHGAFGKELTLPLKNENAQPWRIVAFLQDSGSRQILGVADVRSSETRPQRGVTTRQRMPINFITMNDLQHRAHVLTNDARPLHRGRARIACGSFAVPLTIGFFLANPSHGRIILFEEGNPVLGYAVLVPYWSNEFGGPLVVVDELFVTPKARNRGIAKSFFRFLGKQKTFDSVALALEVSPSNTGALPLYQSLEFSRRTNSLLTYRFPDK